MRLTQGLERAAMCHGNQTATVYEGQKRSWAQVRDRVARLARGLREAGAEAGDRIAIIALNSDRYLEAYYAILWAGCVCVPGNTRWAAAEHAYALNDSEPTLLLVDDAFAPMVPTLRTPGLRNVVHMGDGPAPEGMLSYEHLIETSAPMEDASTSGDALAGIFYTGGTTGWPKGVMLSHAGLIASFLSLSIVSPFSEQTVYLHAAPMFHLADAILVFGLTYIGATHVMQSSFTPSGVVGAIASEGVNTLLLVPTMISMVAEHLRDHPADLSGVTRLSYGASPISESLLRRAMEIFPNAAFRQGYGQTEMSPGIAVLTALDHALDGPKARLLRSAGRPIPLTDVKIVDQSMNAVATGEVGEIVVRGPSMMLGYWRKPELTAETIVDGWLRTGDAGYLDDEGYIFLVDWVKDMIVSGGENVFSAEVENALSKHPAVLECAVVGVPDDRWGERVHAILRLRDGHAATEEDLTRHCAELIAGYKRPRSYEFRTQPLPLSGAGKILKSELRKPYWQGAQRNVG